MAPPPPFSPADRIRELSAINSDMATMLASAGQAIHALTNRPLQTSSTTEEDTNMSDTALEAHQQSFQQNTSAYFHTLQSVFARLRRQAYALEEAGIVNADSSVPGGVIPRAAPVGPAGGFGPNTAGMQNAQTQPQEDRVRNGGLGGFDVGWLNSRGNQVGEEKEAELVKEARELLEEVLEKGKG